MAFSVYTPRDESMVNCQCERFSYRGLVSEANIENEANIEDVGKISVGLKKRWDQITRCCFAVSLISLIILLTVVLSIVQVRPVWPLRRVMEACCSTLPRGLVPPHVYDRFEAIHFGAGGDRNIVGINLPPQQGASGPANFLGPGTGSFHLDGSYNYEYTDAQLEAIAASFGGIRVGFSVDTARNATAVATIRRYFDFMRGRGGVNVLSLWDTIELWETYIPGLTEHGNGRINDVGHAIEAWSTMIEAFSDCDNIMFEVFNEPFGYWTVSGYLREMHAIIDGAGLPLNRVLLSAMFTFWDVLFTKSGWAWRFSDGHLAELGALGWQGAFSYHHYPLFTAAPGDRTVEAYTRKFIQNLAPVCHKHQIHITEFGANLSKDYSGPSSDIMEGSVNSVLGFQAGLRELRSRGCDIASAHWWFGMGGERRDSYNIFGRVPNRSRRKFEELASQINRATS